MVFQKPSSKDFVKLLNNIKVNNKKVLLILNGDEKEYNTFLSSRNLDNVLPVFSTEVMLDDILNSQAIITTQEVLKEIEGRLS